MFGGRGRGLAQQTRRFEFRRFRTCGAQRSFTLIREPQPDLRDFKHSVGRSLARALCANSTASCARPCDAYSEPATATGFFGFGFGLVLACCFLDGAGFFSCTLLGAAGLFSCCTFGWSGQITG